MSGSMHRIGNKRYWTPKRILKGLKLAASEISGMLPAQREYDCLRVGHYDWPPSMRILAIHHSMRTAWLAAGADPSRVKNFNLPWTEDEEEVLLSLAGSGHWTLESLGYSMRRSYGSVRKRLQKHGRKARDNQGTLSAAQIARHYRCSYTRVQNLLARNVIKGRYDAVRHRWQVNPADITREVKRLLKAPRRTHKHCRMDRGDYYQRYGIRRIKGQSVKLLSS
jgi:hypothetical protein